MSTWQWPAGVSGAAFHCLVSRVKVVMYIFVVPTSGLGQGYLSPSDQPLHSCIRRLL